MKVFEWTFECPLPNGLHARPANELADVAAQFAAEVSLTNEHSGGTANAKSVLAVVGLDIRLGNTCRLRITGVDAEAALAALREFVTDVFPHCDEALPTFGTVEAVVLPRSLRKENIRWYAGTPVCPGVGRGTVVVLGGLILPAELSQEPAGTLLEEQEKIRQALAAVRHALEARLTLRPTNTERGILQAHLSIVSDVALSEKIAECLTNGQSAGQAIIRAVGFFAGRLKAAESVYVRERAMDVEDIGLQLLEHIYGERFKLTGHELKQPSIVVAENLTPRQFLALDRNFLQALVLEHGGAASHAVILARSFNISTLIGVADARANLPPAREAVVDAHLGMVIAEVTTPVSRYYDREQRRLLLRRERLSGFAHAPARTRDGRRLEVAANVATVDEITPAFAHGADGIGLFRTEMLFMDRDAPPTEDEQFAVYVQAARTAAGRPVIIRTIDIGGDKAVSYLNLPVENNPFLGYRGVRIYPEYRELIVTQLRAILRASAFGKVWVMVPMICAVDEVRWIKSEIAALQAELQLSQVAFDAAMPVGIMVEVPSVAFLMDQLAPEVDFFSIGTNDLAQYFLAVDRDGDKVAGLYNVRHPAFLRLLEKIVSEARRHGRWIGMCGEMTRDPRNLPLLIGLGLDELSTAAPQISAHKAAIVELATTDCRTVLEKALGCGTTTEVEALLDRDRSIVATGRLLDAELISVGSDSMTKEEAIKEIADAFYVLGRTDRPEAIEEAVWAREAVYSTGLGHGFAIPHCKTDAITANSIGVARLARPIEWQSVDGLPVQCVILLAIRESDPDNLHLQVFSRLARRLMHEEFRERMLAATDRTALQSCLEEELGLNQNPVS